ncbi:MAG: Lrp/AsnC family transcriptional regulator [Actinobacteria bacterium]|nr:Lrp/AsnC family transcriptional regulator [Actinomycetota bacterium]
MHPIDWQIIQILQEDGKTTYGDLAKRVGLSQAAVHERVKKLEARGVITGYRAVVDADALGYGVVAFVFVDNAAFDIPDFTERLQALPNVLECHAVAGEWAYLLKVRAESTIELERVLHQIRTMNDVHRTHSVIGLSTAFETTLLPMPVEQAEAAEEPPQTIRRKSA